MVRKLLIAATAVAMLVSACSTEGGTGGEALEAGDVGAAVAALQAAPDAAVEAGSARLVMILSIETPEGDLQLEGSGAFAGDLVEMELDFGTFIAEQLGGEGVPEGLDQPMRLVVDGTTTYMRMPFLDSFTGSSSWISLDAADLGVAGDSLGMAGGANDPTQILEALRGVADEIEEVGQEDVRGTPTTRYRVVIDLARAADQLPEDQRATFEQQLSQIGDGELPADVWIDEAGLVRRLTLDMAGLADSGEMSAVIESGTMTVELFDYGADIDIAVPDATEAVPFAEVFGSMAGRA